VAGNQPPKISVSDLDNIERLLDQVPAHRDASVSKQKAIGILAPELHAMRAKGYSWKDIATWLLEHGLSVTPVALQGYVRRVPQADLGVRPGAARRKRRRTPNSTPMSTPPAAPAASVPAVSTPRAAPPAPPAVKDVIERRDEPGARRSEFVVRPNSTDI
jgi:hypothetical protein